MTLALHIRRWAAGILAAACLTVGSAQAADFSDEQIAAARDAIKAAHATEQFDSILPVLADQARSLFERSNPAAVKDIDDVISTIALDLAKRRPALNREIEEVWAARFSTDELKQIAAFYNSPVGQKFGQMMPQIIADSVRQANIWRDALSTEIVTRARDDLKKRGYNF